MGPAVRGRRSGGGVVIELSQAQVDKVVREAAGSGNMALVLAGIEDVRVAVDGGPEQLEDSRLSRSLLLGLLLLAAFPADGGYVGNAELGRRLGIHASTAHRYISTLVAVGLLERDPRTRLYRLAQ